MVSYIPLYIKYVGQLMGAALHDLLYILHAYLLPSGNFPPLPTYKR